MDFFLAMSIYGSAPDLSREKGKAQEWMKACAARSNRERPVAEEGKPGGSGEQAKRPREQSTHVGPRFALEFDGLSCFETMVSH